MRHYKNIFFLLITLSLPTRAELNIESLQGVWSKYCDEDGYGYSAIKHSNKNELLIIISSGQVHINSIAKKLDTSSYELYFTSTNDLGPGGMRYEWSNVSTTKPIAVIYNLTPASYSMKWFGVADNDGGRIKLSTEFTSNNSLNKCELLDL